MCNFFLCVHFVTSIKWLPFHRYSIHASHKECFNENCIHNKFQRYVMSQCPARVEIKQVDNEKGHRHGVDDAGDEHKLLNIFLHIHSLLKNSLFSIFFYSPYQITVRIVHSLDPGLPGHTACYCLSQFKVRNCVRLLVLQSSVIRVNPHTSLTGTPSLKTCLKNHFRPTIFRGVDPTRHWVK